jgi:hypothetical protein
VLLERVMLEDVGHQRLLTAETVMVPSVMVGRRCNGREHDRTGGDCRHCGRSPSDFAHR